MQLFCTPDSCVLAFNPTMNLMHRFFRNVRLAMLLTACLGLPALAASAADNSAVPPAWSTPAWSTPAWTPISDVRLEGAWGQHFDAAAARLHAPPLGDLGYDLADVTLDRKRIFTEYSGDISGRMIGAEAFLARTSPEEATTLSNLVAGVVRCQKPDGHFGAVQHLPSLNRAFDMPILWGNGRLLIGLMEANAETGNTNALAAARRLGDYFVATDAVYCRAGNLQSVGGNYADAFSTCYFSCIEGLVALARTTHDARYGRQAEHIAALAVTLPSLENLHSHGRLTTLRGLVSLYELTGDRQWLVAAEHDWQTIFDRYRLPTGGVSERFSRSDERDEGCAVADWLRFNLVLWRATGRNACLDEAEHCLKNHFFFNQFASGGSGHRSYTMLNGEPVAFAGGGTEAYWCCCEHWPRAMEDVARLVVTSAPDGLNVNLAVDAAVKLNSAGTQWQVKTSETADGLRVEIAPQTAVKATLHLHRPAWAEAAEVQAPRGFKVMTVGDEWRVTGRWMKRQVVQIQFHSAVRREQTAAGATVFLRGNDVLVAHAIPVNAWLFQSNWKSLPAVAGEPVFAPGAISAVVPAGVGAGRLHSLELAPMRARDGAFPHKCWFEFAMASADSAGGLDETPDPPAGFYLTLAATAPSRVMLNGKEIARGVGWNSPVDGFQPQQPAGRNTLLVVCEAAENPALPPGVIAGLSGCVAPPGAWQVRACTADEAQSDAAALAARDGWQSATAFDPSRVPSRENQTSVLDDLPPDWVTGATTAEKPVLVLRRSW